MRLHEIMSAPVQTARPDEAADDAWRRMRAAKVHHLVVLDGKQVAGVISDRDLGGRGGASLRRGRTVEEVMTAGVVTAKPDATVREAANLLRGHGIGCLPVVDGTRLVGMVTISDLLALLGKGAQRPVVEGRRWTLKHRGPRRRGITPSELHS